MPDLRQRIETYFEDRFGVERSFWKPYRFKEKSDSYWLLADALEPDTDVIAQGLRLLRERRVRMKPTSHGLRFMEPQLNENIIELSQKEVKRLIVDREELDGYDDVTEGYVALAFDGHVLGCGRKRRTGIETQISKGRASELEAMLAADPTIDR